MSSANCSRETKSNPTAEAVAIIGMACIFPGAPDLQTYWQNIVSKRDAISDPPPEAWDSDMYYDPDSTQDDRVYCKRGGYIGPLARFNPTKYGIMPTAVQGGEPDQWLALQVAYDALADAGYDHQIPQAKRTAVILGKGTYLNHGNLSMVQRGLVVDQTLEIIKTLHPEFGEKEQLLLRRELRRWLPPFNPETAQGLIPNVIAGRIANRLNLNGPAYTVDGACASSILAIEIAVRDLQSEKIDLALVGGAQVSTPVPILGLFCQINALSRRQQIRPFDKDADGTVLGEGIGMVVLRRLSEAEREGNRIYAVIKGVGSSSDGRGLSVLAPRVEGEELALQRAYRTAGISPQTVGLIEAHGTGTPTGDLAEIQALTRVFGARNGSFARCAIGSVKSMISHTMTAAGIAGVIKATLSLYHKVLPPTLNVETPNPKLELEKTPFYLNTETRPWFHGFGDAPRRAGVNSFGFGGINAHAILEEYAEDDTAPDQSYAWLWDSEVCIIEAKSRTALIERLQEIQHFLSQKPNVALKNLAFTLNSGIGQDSLRLGIVAVSLEDLSEKLGKALRRIKDPKCRKIKHSKGIYFFEQPLYPRGKIAFLFPGEGAQYVNMLEDLAVHFPEVRACFDRADRIFSQHERGNVPTDYIFPPPEFSADERKGAEEKIWKMDGAIEAVLTANDGLFSLLSQLKIRPDAVLGHSTGEYSALQVSGVLDILGHSDGGQKALELNRSHEITAARGGFPQARLVAVGTDSQTVQSLITRVQCDAYVGMNNCPHQTVVVGIDSEIDKLLAELNQRGLIYQVLPFDRPYHTPLFEAYAEGLRKFFRRWPISQPGIPLYSCTTAQLYPDGADEIRELAVEHWIRPVEFRKTIEKLYADGVRIFIEVGARGNLSAFVEDILRGRDFIAVPANVQHRTGIAQLNHLVGILAACGVPMDLGYLYKRRAPLKISFADTQSMESHQSDNPIIHKLSTGWPAMQLSTETAQELLAKTAGQKTATTIEPSSIASGTETLDKSPGSEWPARHKNGPVLVRQARKETDVFPGGSGQVMSTYLQTMERFLEVQEEVMQAFLDGKGKPAIAEDQVTVGAPAEDIFRDSRLDGFAATVEITPKEITKQQMSQSDAIATIAEQPAQEDLETREEKSDIHTVEQLLLQIVSQKTGYPTEVLDLEANMEADLGIDSIKRIEIIGELSNRCNVSLDQDMERVAGFKTLQQVLDFLQTSRINSESKESGSQRTPEELPGRNANEIRENQSGFLAFPFIKEIAHFVPDQKLVALRRISLDTDRYLEDHMLGRTPFAAGNRHHALAVMPLTMSMEILAEAGAVLAPQLVLVGMKDIVAYRWIALERSTVILKIVARRSAESQNEVAVKIYDDPQAPEESTIPVVEGMMIFADRYPTPFRKKELALRDARPSNWRPEDLYTQAMFHGPNWQGVSSVDSWGKNGCIASLKVLPRHDFFPPDIAPNFVTDPIVLDAAGQIVGFWTMEHLDHGFLVFPYRLKALHIYGSNLSAGRSVQCLATINVIGPQQISSNFDLIDDNGRPWMRLEGWEDKRFDLPRPAYQFLVSPIDFMASAILDASHPALAKNGLLLGVHSKPLFKQDAAFWLRVFSFLILSERERKAFHDLDESTELRSRWLMERLVAKDAVRSYLRTRHELIIGPADIELEGNVNGCLCPVGTWKDKVDSSICAIVTQEDGFTAVVANAEAGKEIIGLEPDSIQNRLNAGPAIATNSRET